MRGWGGWLRVRHTQRGNHAGWQRNLGVMKLIRLGSHANVPVWRWIGGVGVDWRRIDVVHQNGRARGVGHAISGSFNRLLEADVSHGTQSMEQLD